MKISQSLAGLCLVALLSACGGGGSGDAGQGTVGTQPSVPTNQLVPLARYTGPTGTFQQVNLKMPVSGIVDFSLQGTNVRIFDTAMNPVGQGSFTPWGTYQKNLVAGAYVVEFQYWSANSKHAIVYSPTLLAFGDLPQLRNAVYSSDVTTTTYYRASFATASTINSAGSGTEIGILDSNMNIVNYLALNSSVTLPAGDYIFRFMFWSANSKSVSITSPGLP